MFKIIGGPGVTFKQEKGKEIARLKTGIAITLIVHERTEPLIMEIMRDIIERMCPDGDPV